MLVTVLSFGTNWWARSSSRAQVSHPVFYNSTGLRCGRKVRRHWLVPGILRFNYTCLDPRQASAAGQSTFICSDLASACGGNRLLFEGRKPHAAVPECYLVTISSPTHGVIDFSSRVW